MGIERNGSGWARAACGTVVLGVLWSVGWGASGCASTRIAMSERLGYAKREQLVDRVKEARDEQEAAKEQFQSALEEFLAVTRVDGGALEAQYSKLKKEHERSESRAEAVRDRIRSVERVAGALFKEWEAELGAYSSESMRRASEQRLEDTKDRYERMVGAMQGASKKMDPVLAAFSDQVLFLKHNLNARAIASLADTTAEIETDVATLVRDMEASIDEANRFIEEMGASEG